MPFLAPPGSTGFESDDGGGRRGVGLEGCVELWLRGWGQGGRRRASGVDKEGGKIRWGNSTGDVAGQMQHKKLQGCGAGVQSTHSVSWRVQCCTWRGWTQPGALVTATGATHLAWDFAGVLQPAFIPAASE
jgi:hypothetical protein